MFQLLFLANFLVLKEFGPENIHDLGPDGLQCLMVLHGRPKVAGVQENPEQGREDLQVVCRGGPRGSPRTERRGPPRLV